MYLRTTYNVHKLKNLFLMFLYQNGCLFEIWINYGESFFNPQCKHCIRINYLMVIVVLHFRYCKVTDLS